MIRPRQIPIATKFIRIQHAQTLDPFRSRVIVTLRCIVSVSQCLPAYEQLVGASWAIVIRQYAGIGHSVSKSISQRVVAHFRDCFGC